MNSTEIKLSIIIPVFKDLEGLKSTIEDLQSSKIPFEFEMIVCNDGADEKISQWLKSRLIHEILIKTQKGSYFARNRGIEASNHNWLLFVDAGVKIKPNWFQLIADKTYHYSYFAFDINLEITKNLPLLQRYSQFTEFRCKQYWEQNHFGPTAFLLVEKRIFNETSLFNEQLYSGGDFELGNRCWHAGFKMTFIENEHIFHPPRCLWRKYKKQIRVLKGIQQIQNLYPTRIMKLPNITWKEFFLGPLKFLYTIKKIKQQPAVKEGNWHIITTIWAEFWHQKMYNWALLKVLTSKKARFE